MSTSSPSSATRKARAWRPLIAEGIVLLTFWIVMSGKIAVLPIVSGILAVSFVIWLDRRLGPLTNDEEEISLHGHFLRLPVYLPWLFKEMIKSTWNTGKVVLSPRGRVKPRLVSFRSVMPNGAAQVILGNSITLTPGTLTLEIDGDTFWVHALDEHSARSLVDGAMQDKVARLFTDQPGAQVSEVKSYRKKEEMPW